MKPAIYYAIKPGMYGYSIIAVTSEKERRSAWFGRDTRDNSATHGTRGGYYGILGRYPTQEAAQADVDKIAAVKAKHDPIIKQASDILSAVKSDERRAIEAVTNRPPAHV